MIVAEEYGCTVAIVRLKEHFVQVVNSAGDVLMSHDVQPGDIWRACQAKDAPIKDWVQLAVRRSRDSGMPAVFWLDESRAHDRNLITKVEQYLAEEDTDGLDLRILSPAEATKFTVERLRRGGTDIELVRIEGGKHAMLKHGREFDGRAARFTADVLLQR